MSKKDIRKKNTILKYAKSFAEGLYTYKHLLDDNDKAIIDQTISILRKARKNEWIEQTYYQKKILK